MVADKVVVQQPQGRRRAGLAVGVGRPQRLHRPGGAEPAAARHGGHAAPEGRRQGVPGLVEDPPDRADLFRPYRASRSSSSTGPRPATPRPTCAEPRADQRGQRDLDPAQGRDHRGAVQGVLPPRRARLRRAVRAGAFRGRGHAHLHGAAVRAEHAAVRPLRPEASPWGEALRAPGVHHRRPRDADAALSALRQRRGRQRGPAAQRQPRDAAARRRASPRCARRWSRRAAGRAGRQGQAGRRGGRGRGEPKTGRATTTGGPSSARCSRKASTRTPTIATKLLELARFRSTRGTGWTSLADYVGADEGGPGGDLLHQRREPHRAAHQPAARAGAGQGGRGAAARRPGRRVLAAGGQGLSGHAAALADPRRGRPVGGQGRGRAGDGRKRRWAIPSSSG